MKLEDVKIMWDESLHNNKDGALIATDIKPVFQYVNSKKTDNIIAYNVTVVDTLNKFEKTTVRVEKQKKPFEIHDDAYLSVYFINLRGKPYMDFANSTVKFSIACDDVQVLDDVS